MDFRMGILREFGGSKSMKRSRIFLGSLCLCLTFALGCGGGEGGTNTTTDTGSADTGTSNDTGTVEDQGTSTDTGTGVDTNPPPQDTGPAEGEACLTQTDNTIIESGQLQTILDGCAASCTADEACLSTCLNTGGFTPACSDCIGAFYACSVNNCEVCEGGIDGTLCLGCLHEQGCAASLESCGGLIIPDPPDIGGGVNHEGFTEVPCPADLHLIDELEPNDASDLSNPITVPDGANGFCIRGGLLCGSDGGNSYANDLDFFDFTSPVTANAEFQLDWAESGDWDFTVVSNDEELITFVDGMGTSEVGSTGLVTGSTYAIRLGCWAGTDGAYAMWVRWGDTTEPPVCTPDCEGKECGDDGCDGVCGTCDEGQLCGMDGLCSVGDPGPP
ncbi:MAG: hypothetical protein CMH54_10200 [Myxococcales bacterium]|nr:hypothetical protein [Myxococcales bacterium]